ncbi:UDP-glucose 4-epimerase [Paenibacillus sp. cl6col]|uniref:UDP-glucose 4-epimerase n=1 Tax=Paenibacillus alvei TaxID=44250 RepID=A0ABT4E8A8_PAEAL|nr:MULTISPECIES: UDP-glucose 4-epimerase GalE [Paenibacillus]MCY9528606.1 UDP-glucose 4-epimerase GalE [Paenibacillus alvei]SDG22395.1 UDP-glucose 4-epimerase [Paenibacillus sp. cl6col]
MSILVTGGAGYIGSHTVQALLEQEEQVIVVDNLSTGHQNAVKNVELVQCDIRDKEALSQVFRNYNIEAVVHFAASSLVGESMQKPGKYYDNNIYGTLCLLEIMVQHGVTKIVFSSTAATYGNPEIIPITESEATKPTNAYGETKLAMESMMKWFDIAHGLKYVALRYFNAAGAHENGIIGEDHQPETHLIPLILQVPLGKRDYISVFGNDYDTADGTCIRDYIHVSDLADAHIKSIHYLKSGGESAVFNLGNGNGYSVLEMINAARAVTGHPIPAKMEERRAGDPAVLVANAQKSREILQWEPKWTNIEEIIHSAWKWHSANPNGYER